jgi:glyceraldehyde-3-phosphate dehydrogenase (NAD(P))
MKVKVAVNGYGTIGKRIANAVMLQDDMELIGVSKVTPDFTALLAQKRGIKIYTNKQKEFREAGIETQGNIEDMVKVADVIIDATPNGVGATYKELYKSNGKKAIFQGGEKASVAEVSFNSLANYKQALGKSFVRVVSCNTTALTRVISTLDKSFGVTKIRASIIRRGSDINEVKKGPLDSINFDPPKSPSHHAEDVKTILPNLDIFSMAVAVPSPLMHVHVIYGELREKVKSDDIIEVLSSTNRIVTLSAEEMGIEGTGNLFELARELGRHRSDMPEVIVIEDSIKTFGNEFSLIYTVHQESIVVPENIDAIRAITGIERDAIKSIEKTDKSLGIMKGKLKA